jgi:YidC/Oxa1 family membrane protein insertase
MIGHFFNLILIQPLLNVLIWLYNIIPGHDLGLAIIALTVLIRLLLFPSFQKSLRSQKELQQIQPKLDALREKYKDDKEAQTKAILEFYKEHKVNPFSSCLPLLVQLPILLALYRVFLSGLKGDVASELYKFVANPGPIHTNFLGLVELSKSNYVFAFLAGIFQFIQSKMITPKPAAGVTQDKTASLMTAQLTYFMPVVTVLIALRLPAALSLYWVVTTLFAIGQQYYIMKKT